jgi:hypothetical protein
MDVQSRVKVGEIILESGYLQDELLNRVQSFAVDVINNLRNRTVPTLWALKSIPADGATSTSAIDIIKGLI